MLLFCHVTSCCSTCHCTNQGVRVSVNVFVLHCRRLVVTLMLGSARMIPYHSVHVDIALGLDVMPQEF
jgi:hypothetical protein